MSSRGTFYCNANNPGSPVKVNKEVHKQQALELRMKPRPDGRLRSYAMIAEEMGVPSETVRYWIVEALTEIRHDSRERARELRTINTQRIEFAIGKLMTKISNGTANDRDYNTFLRLIQAENKMWGVNEPDAIELTVKIDDMTTEEKIARISELMELAHRRQLTAAAIPQWAVIEGEAVEVNDKPNGRTE